MPAAQTETAVSIHKILFATDLTKASTKAFKYVKALARHFQASVINAHVLRASAQDWPRFGIDPEYKKLCHETKQALAKLSRQLRHAGCETDDVLLEGDPVEGILEAVKRHRADLLVLGTHGLRDVERLVLGSIAEEILRKTSCPVFTVGPNVRDPHRGIAVFRHILLATDFAPRSAAVVPYAFAFAGENASHISVCHVLPEGHTRTLDANQLQKEFTEAAHKLMSEQARTNSTTEYLVEYGNAADEILQLAAKQNAELIVLGAHSAGVIATHLAPGVAFRVIAGAACPVLTFHADREHHHSA